jgi:7-cyano-7-deazaguanine synthase in queuosine biosynthesis
MKITCQDQTVADIDIPNHLSHIGVMLSGGMDSSLMLFLILKEMLNLEKTITLTVFNVPKGDSKTQSRKIVNFLEKEFNTSINLVHLGDITLPHNKIINVPVGYILDNKLVDRLYSGVNQNPPFEFPNVMSPKRKPPDSVIPDNLCFPFIRLYKTHILEIYKKFNVLELADLTQSCETQANNIRCNTCFHCHERAWAYTELNLIDNGE